MKTTSSTCILLAFASTTLVLGCAAATPPQDLQNARTAYSRASQGPAQQLDPAGMHVARQQLDAAEVSFEKDGDTQQTRDQAYLAVRKTELAEVHARTTQSTQAKERVVEGMQSDQKQTVALTSAALGRTKNQLATQGVALEAETRRRQDAEKRAAQAAADLAKFASVKQEPRGMVITLSGSVLFASAKWALLPAAQLKLNEVATALTREDPTSKIVVEGHTDSQGADAFNQDLSQKRAQAVRDYLVTRGIAADRVTAHGFGETRTVAENTSPEGRANNRRVEIVVQPAGAKN
ncbi:MAG: OmpA family protein [Myxococcales bacterium]|nr:OmpA family protein [Myxococcales bacterium]